MKKRTRIISLLLSLVMILPLLPISALAAANTFTCSVTLEVEPAEGKKPTTAAVTKHPSKKQEVDWFAITSVKWSGELDANGCFKPGVAYTVTVTAQMSDKYPDYKFRTGKAIISMHSTKTATVSEDGRSITASYTYSKLKSDQQIAAEEAEKQAKKDAKEEAEAAKDHAAAVASYWSAAEAGKVENYPLGSPITLVVNEETLKDTDYYVMDIASSPYSTGTPIMAQFSRAVFHTLDGETIDNRGLRDVDGGTSGYNTNPSYRVTRVVYDLYREDDPSIDQFPNCTELWLSPKCDIDGILRSLGKITLQTQFVGDFYEESCTVFIPDTLYPNGPTYTDGNAPACRVMLYSGGDVYAAARAGKSAAREWCTNHSYTRAYISDDRMYSFPTCSADARFYYTCAKCGKVERNPKHTFYPTAGSYDNGEDGGKNTAHDFVNKVVTDEHYLGLNSNGDRVYLYTCSVCGKDARQAADASEKKFWDPNGSGGAGAYYKQALEKTTVGKDHPRGTYAISNSAYVSAKQHGWATAEVLAASEAGLIDKTLMGSDYTGSINRLQFCSVAVKLAEKMAGKTITPVPSGTFNDTDSEYVRKAAAAGITSGAGGGGFDPNGVLTRQQMAAFLYRALQWVKANSDLEYTVYESKLGSYTDAGQLASWAREPMAFMNALGLVGGTSDTTLSPNAACTIEQAIAVASRSLCADRIGWYQYTKSGSDWLHYGDRVWVYFKNEKGSAEPVYKDPYGNELGITLVRLDNSTPWRPIKDR